MTEPTDPTPAPDAGTPAAATDGAPSKAHGDPLLAASQGATDNTEGSRHGYDATHPEERDDAS